MKCLITFAAAAALVVAGCSHTSLPPSAITETHSAISAAEAVGAQNNPQGALHLKLARDSAQEAEALLRDGKDDRARVVLERAKVDAELALVLTRAASMHDQASQAEQQVQGLQRRE